MSIGAHISIQPAQLRTKKFICDDVLQIVIDKIRLTNANYSANTIYFMNI